MRAGYPNVCSSADEGFASHWKDNDMVRKTLISAMATIVLATSPVSATTTTASASDRDLAVGLAVGAAALIIGAAAYDNQQDYDRHYKRNHRRHHYNAGYSGSECFEKAIRKYDPYYGKKVIVGYRTVCR